MRGYADTGAGEVRATVADTPPETVGQAVFDGTGGASA